jgi:hypothetical protein
MFRRAERSPESHCRAEPEPVNREPERACSRVVTDELSIDLGANGRSLGEREDRTRSGPIVYLPFAENEGEVGACGNGFVLQAEHVRSEQLQ